MRLVKICGITSVAVAKAAKEYGADLIGLVFADSRRRIDIALAQKISKEVVGASLVGVFVNAPLLEVNTIAKLCKLDFVQLHGEETAEYCRAVVRPVIKAVRANLSDNEVTVQKLNQYPAKWILLDSFTKDKFGGLGVPFDWQHYQLLRQKLQKTIMLAGGLNLSNISSAIKILQPDGVDVSSGVETNGIKDPEKIKEFIDKIKDRSEYFPSLTLAREKSAWNP